MSPGWSHPESAECRSATVAATVTSKPFCRSIAAKVRRMLVSSSTKRTVLGRSDGAMFVADASRGLRGCRRCLAGTSPAPFQITERELWLNTERCYRAPHYQAEEGRRFLSMKRRRHWHGLPDCGGMLQQLLRKDFTSVFPLDAWAREVSVVGLIQRARGAPAESKSRRWSAYRRSAHHLGLMSCPASE
jgi:hypothetical protein